MPARLLWGLVGALPLGAGRQNDIEGTDLGVGSKFGGGLEGHLDARFLLGSAEPMKDEITRVQGMVLNIHLSEALLSEGVARDLVRHIQELRKEADFEMNDRIHLFHEASGKIRDVFKKHADYIKAETLSLEIHDALESDVVQKEIKLGSEKLVIGVKK